MNNKRFLKALGLIIVVALLATALPLQAKAQGETPQTLNVADWSDPATVTIGSGESAVAAPGRETVLFDGTKYHMWYSPSESTIFHTSSTTPNGFDAGTALTFTGGTPAGVDSVSVVKEGDTFYMIAYEKTGSTDPTKKFAIYTSDNGDDWVYGGVVFDGTTAGISNFIKIDGPFLIKIGEAYRLYFQLGTGADYDSRTYDIYVAESSDIEGPYELRTTPVLTKGVGTWDGADVMHPWVVEDNGTYYMWYSADNNTSGSQKIGMAKSEDGYTWVKSPGNPIFNDRSLYGYSEPSVIKVGNTWHMWTSGVHYLTASGPFEFSKIGDAIEAASAGDTILVWPGEYVENLEIDKPLTLKAAASEVVITKDSEDEEVEDAPLITITSQDVNLVGLTLDGYDVAVVVDTEGVIFPYSLTSTAHWNIEYCSFKHEGIYIVNLTDFQVMAENNWWGSAGGPTLPAINFIGDVDYVPWLRIPGLELVPVEGMDNPQIEENKDPGTLVGTFRISDFDELDLDPDEVYTLELVKSELYPDNDLFTIDDDFNLKSTAELNFEDPEHDPTYTIYVRVTDSWDNIWEGEFEITVTDANDAPVLTLPDDLPTVIDEGEAISFTAEADDEDEEDTLTFSLEGEVPEDAEIPAGEFSWTPDEAQGPGEYTFDVCVSDGELEDCETITITVNEVNVAPVANNDAYNVLKGTKLVVPAPGVLGNDTDDDEPENTLSAEVVLPPVGGEFVLNPDGSFEFTPPTSAVAPASFEFRYKVSDGAGKESAEAKVTLKIKNTNDVPTLLVLDPSSQNEETVLPYTGTLSVTDDDPDTTSLQHIYSFATGLGGEDNDKFDIVGNQLIAKAPFDYETKEQYKVRIQAIDFFGDSVVNSFTITVVDVNDAPVLGEIGDKEVDELDTLEFVATATDEDTDEDWNELVFSLVDAPTTDGPEIDPETGEFTWTPTEAQGPGEYTFDICVSDETNNVGSETDIESKDCETITITVNEVNVAPELTLPDELDEEIPEEEEWDFFVTASDEDRGPKNPEAELNKLTFSLEGAPDGAKISNDPLTKGKFTWKPSEEQGPDEYTFTVKVCDDGEPVLCDEEEITIEVVEVNVAPVANDDFYTVTGNELFVPKPGVLANDTDADIPANTLTASYNSDLGPGAGTLVMYSDGSFRYTKPEDLPEDLESITFTYTVSDGVDNDTASVSNGEVTNSTATVTLLLKNSPPVGISLDPTEIDENVEFVGVLTTEDPNEADVHVYTLVDTCEGGTLDNDEFTIEEDEDGNDVLRAESLNYEAKATYSVCVRSTDLFGEYVDQKLDIRVIDVNEAPEAKSQDLTTSVNKPIEITLEGIDPEGSELTYAVFSFPTKGTLSVTEVPSINNFADNGVLAIVLRNLTYTPNPDFVEGEDSFTFKVMDATGLVSELATVTIKIEAAPTQQFIFLPIILK